MDALEYLQSLSDTLFWDVNRETVEPEKNQRFLICRVMDRGTREDVRNTFAYYSEAVVLKNLQEARSLDRKTIHYFANRYNLPFESFRAWSTLKIGNWQT